MNPFQAIPASVRKWLYLTYGVAGLVPTSVATYQIAVGGEIPPWCVGLAAVLGVLGPALGFTAGANVGPPTNPGTYDATGH